MGEDLKDVIVCSITATDNAYHTTVASQVEITLCSGGS